MAVDNQSKRSVAMEPQKGSDLDSNSALCLHAVSPCTSPAGSGRELHPAAARPPPPSPASPGPGFAPGRAPGAG